MDGSFGREESAVVTGENTCAMCGNRPADRGLLCPVHRAEDQAISARDSDRSPEGGNGAAGAVHESAGRETASPERI